MTKSNIVQKPSVETVHFAVEEGLMLPSADILPTPYTTNMFYRIPADWVENGEVKAEHLWKIERQMSGGNSETIEGAFYVATDYSAKVLDLETVKTTDWKNKIENDDNVFMFFIASATGEIKKVTANEFQADVDADLQDGEFEQNLVINERGAVHFATSIVPFCDAIEPLLADYQGTGEYLTLLAFDPIGKREEVEYIQKNAHGAYLQIRRFLYLNPKNNVRIRVNAVHSSHLRNMNLNAELTLSFELCKNLDNQTAALYYAFQGAKSEVRKLMEAIRPLLESVGYEAVSS